MAPAAAVARPGLRVRVRPGRSVPMARRGRVTVSLVASVVSAVSVAVVVSVVAGVRRPVAVLRGRPVRRVRRLRVVSVVSAVPVVPGGRRRR